jgi:hypothetical protein
VHEIPGYEVWVDGWLLFVHKEIWAHRRNEELSFKSGKNANWMASEKSSGARITYYSMSTREMAVRNAASWLTRQGGDRVAGIILKFMADRDTAQDINFNQEKFNAPADYDPAKH